MDTNKEINLISTAGDEQYFSISDDSKLDSATRKWKFIYVDTQCSQEGKIQFNC